MRSIIGKPEFYGKWDEESPNSNKVLNTIANIWNVENEAKLNSVPIMLIEYDLNYLTTSKIGCITYDESI